MKSTFTNDIKYTLGSVLKKNGFKTLTVIRNHGYIMFGKRYSEDLAVYVRCTDGRSNNHNVDVDYFFVPVHSPDDSIENFGVGIKINILSIYDVNDNIMINAGKKIVSLFNSMNNFEDFVMAELANPFIKTKWYEYYIRAKKIYKTLICDDKYKDEFLHFIDNMYLDLKMNKNYKSSWNMCLEFVTSLPSDCFDEEISVLSDDIVTDLLCEEIYNNFILDY